MTSKITRLFISSLLWPAILLAQENIRLQQIGVKDGLSQADVKCFVQDKDGFMWIGTRDGLNKFDGNKFTQYGRRFNDSTSLYFNQILDLKLDSSGNIWIASVGGISCYDTSTDTFRNYLLPGETAVTTQINNLFFEDAETIVLSTSEGVIKFNIPQTTFLPGNDYSVVSKTHVAQFYSDTNLGTWIATDKGLYVKRPVNEEWSILCIGINIHHVNPSGHRVFISTSRGFYSYDLTTSTLQQIKLPFESQSTTQSLLTTTGELWIACNRVAVLDANSLSVKYTFSREENNTTSLTEDRARALYQSSDGMIWIGTFGYGLNKHDPYTKNFHYLGINSSIPLSSNYITSILTDDDNNLLIGTSRGLNLVNLDKKINRPHFQGDDLFIVYKMKKDSDGLTWVATSRGFFKYKDGKFIQLNFNQTDIPDFIEWDANTLLGATRLHGLFLVNKDNSGVRQLATPLDVKEVSTVLMRKDRIWVGGQDGLRVLSKDGRLLKHFKSQASNLSSLHSDIIKCLVEDKEKNLWIGTWGGGLSRYNDVDSTFTTFDQSNGLPNSTVYGVIEDRKGFLWISTNMGLSRFDPHDIAFKNFNFESGLQGNEFNTGAYFESGNGIIYFGGTDGLTFFDPDSVISVAQPASVLITDVNINNIPVARSLYGGINSTNDLQLTWNRTNVGIGFTSVDYRNADKIIFQFSVDNDTAWSTIENRRNLELVNLPSGRHVIHLRAKRSGDAWGPPTTLALHVQPAFWRTTSFLLFVSGFLLLSVYFFYRIRVNYLKRLNLRLQKLVDDRTREIQLKNEEISAQNEKLTLSSEKLALLNDELEEKIVERTKSIQQLNTDLQEQNKQLEQFSFITAHNFRGPIARIKGLINLIGPESKENLAQITTYLKLSADNLDEVIQDLNEILEIKKEGERQSQAIELRPELDLALSLVEEDLISKNIRVDLSDFEDHSIRGHKSYVQSIFSNLLANAIKYADSTKGTSFIKVNCVAESDRLRVEFIDDGVGFNLDLASSKLFMPYQRFNESHSGKGLGLYIVKTQVNLMNGEITVESQPGVGSTFRMYFPLVHDNHTPVN